MILDIDSGASVYFLHSVLICQTSGTDIGCVCVCCVVIGVLIVFCDFSAAQACVS